MDRAWLEANRALWDDRVPLHVRSEFYGVDEFKAGAPALHDFELADVGDVAGKSLVHLQCHFGMDSLDWARRGARVTGLDFSEPALAAARALGAELGIAARFEVGDVYDAPRVLGERYDIVYTGRGALNWLPDIARWAELVAALLVPGGFLYLTEFHPVTDAMADGSVDFVRDYFHRSEAYVYDDGLTYVETDERTSSRKSFEWCHPTSEVITALLGVGLTLELFNEHAFTVYQRFPWLERDASESPRVYRMPPGRPSLPMMYSVRARKGS